MGCIGIGGTPTVDEVAGCINVREIAETRTAVKEETIKQMLAIGIRQTCVSFIGAHNRWPKINTSKMPPDSALTKAIVNQSIHLNLFSPNYPLEHWEMVDFGKEFDMDYHTDYTDVCDDKAISSYLSEAHKNYCPQMTGIIGGPTKSSRRVLIEMLKKANIDIKEIFQKIQDRQVPDDWKIIMLHAKERELKIKPRLFAMMPLEMRIYFCVTEANISKEIFKYFPQQTMTMAEGKLTKRMMAITKVEEESMYFSVIINIDFQSWNIHWCYLATVEFFKMIDKLFGTPGLYTYTHEFFQECVVILSSYFDPLKH